jgi:hypothetical protein
MTLALEAPQRLEKLVLCNTAPKIGTLEFWNTRIETVETKGMREVAQAVTARWFTLAFQKSSPKSPVGDPDTRIARPAGLHGRLHCRSRLRFPQECL